jgi:hypothetical protein
MIASFNISGATIEKVLGMTEYLVEADSFSKHELWAKYSGEGMFRPIGNGESFPTVKWEQIHEGRLQEIGQVTIKNGRKTEKMPVVLNVFWALLDGKLIGFYEATSRVVDWRMVEKYLIKHFPHGPARMTDAQNFHHVIHFVQGR